MTDPKGITAEQIDADLFGPDYVFLRLPPFALDVSAAFAEAIAVFDAGEREAARKATWWLQNCALAEYHTSRTYLYLGRRRIGVATTSLHDPTPSVSRRSCWTTIRGSVVRAVCVGSRFDIALCRTFPYHG